jgi:hypothetical protein
MKKAFKNGTILPSTITICIFLLAFFSLANCDLRWLRFAIKTTVLAKLGLVYLPCPAPKSISDAKLQGMDVEAVQVQPREFNWNKHLYKVHEAWYQTPPKLKYLNTEGPEAGFAGYVLTFEIDGKFPCPKPELGFRGNYGSSQGANDIVYNFEDFRRQRRPLVLHICDRTYGKYRVKDPPQPGEPTLSVHILE